MREPAERLGEGADLYSMYFRYVSPLERRQNSWIEAVNQEYVSLFLISYYPTGKVSVLT